MNLLKITGKIKLSTSRLNRLNKRQTIRLKLMNLKRMERSPRILSYHLLALLPEAKVYLTNQKLLKVCFSKQTQDKICSKLLVVYSRISLLRIHHFNQVNRLNCLVNPPHKLANLVFLDRILQSLLLVTQIKIRPNLNKKPR